MATFTLASHTYEINSYEDLAMVRAKLEELHRMKRISDSTYEIKSHQLDQFPNNHQLKK